MRSFFPISMLCLAAGAVNACKPDEVVSTENIPTAGIRFVNAVPDTGGMDFRPVDIVENSQFYNVTFKSTTLLYYKNARAGTRHFKIFRTPTATDPAEVQLETAKTVVADLANEMEQLRGMRNRIAHNLAGANASCDDGAQPYIWCAERESSNPAAAS